MLLLAPCALFAQEVSYPCQKLIEQGQYQKAVQKLNKMHDKTPNDCEVNYALYRYYNEIKNPGYDIRNAYKCLSDAHNNFEQLDAKAKGKLRKEGYVDGLFRSEYCSVSQKGLEYAISLHTIDAYNDFLSYYRQASSNQIRQAEDARNALAFADVRHMNTEQAYIAFINTYPGAKEISEATRLRDSVAYSLAEKQNTIEAYREFLNKYPYAKESESAQQHIYAIGFTEAEKGGTVESYRAFAKRYPKSPQSIEATKRADQLQFAQETDSKDWLTYKSFISRHKQEPSLVSMAQQAIYEYARRMRRIEAIEYGINNMDGALKDSCFMLMHDIYASTANIHDLETFWDEYYDYSFKALRTHDMEAISAYEDYSEYGGELAPFIKIAAPYSSALYALIHGISSFVDAKQFDKAYDIVALFQDEFGDNKDYLNLLRLLSSPTDETIKIVNAGPNINTSTGGEYAPTISADGKSLLFCGSDRSDNLGGEDIYISKLSSKGWGRARLMQGVNTKSYNESPKSLSADGTTMTLFQSGMLCSAQKTKNGWQTPVPLSENINIGTWQSDAMMTSDGKAMLFASRKQSPHEFKESVNIYVSLLDENGEWGEPIDLGPTINTPFIDRSPVLHPDMKTLYFSSEGHGALGSLDVFVSTRLSEDSWTEWSEPVNLGKEINTIGADCWYKISTDGKSAYFSKTDMVGNQDIFWLTLPERLRPNPVATISGKLTDPHGRPITTEIRWEDLETHEQVGQSKTDPEDGSFFIVLPEGKNYGYYIDDEIYFPVASNIDLRNKDELIEIENNIQVATITQMIEESIPMPLNNLFFNTGEAELLPASITELQRVVDILKQRTLMVEIGGHTDNVGDDASNMELSQRRADSVKSYLIQHGIDETRIKTVGYGESKPVASNNTESGRSKNRRVEIKFIK